MRSFSSFIVLALTAASVLATPLDTRAEGKKVLSSGDGTSGTVEGSAADFSAVYHASGFLSQQGCDTSAKITDCYTAELAPTGQVETKDHPPFVTGTVNQKQTSVLIMAPVTVTGKKVTHKFKIALSEAFNKIPAGEVVTLASFHNLDETVGDFSTFALEAKTFTGEETSGTYIYLNAVDKTNGPTFPIQFPGFADGNTVEFTFEFDTTLGSTVSSSVNGVQSSKQGFAANAIEPGTQHAITLGPIRNLVDGSQDIVAWFGDYSVSQE